MQHKAVCVLVCKFTLYVSGVIHTNHQEYTKLTTASGSGHIFCAATSLQRVQARTLLYVASRCTIIIIIYVRLYSVIPPPPENRAVYEVSVGKYGTTRKPTCVNIMLRRKDALVVPDN